MLVAQDRSNQSELTSCKRKKRARTHREREVERKTHTPFTQWENAYISMRFGLSFTRKRRFYHGKRSFLKTPAKVEISENSVFVFACELGETEFKVLKRHSMRLKMHHIM